MKVTYDPEVDVLRILFSAAAIHESDEDKPGVILDFDKDGNIVGLEVLDASRQEPSLRRIRRRRMNSPSKMATTGVAPTAPERHGGII